MLFYKSLLPLVAWLQVCVPTAFGAGPAVPITSADTVRNLSAEEAAQAYPIHLRGTVITLADPVGQSFVMTDGQDCIYVSGHPDLIRDIRGGDVVEITGSTDPGDFAPMVALDTCKVLGRAPLPEARKIGLVELENHNLDAHWVEVSGVVRSCRTHIPRHADYLNASQEEIDAAVESGIIEEHSILTLAQGLEKVAVEVKANLRPEDVIDAKVTVRGVCLSQHNNRRQFIRPILLVPEGQLIITKPPQPRLFESAPIPISSLFQFDPEGQYDHRVHLRGTVTHVKQGQAIWISDDDRGLMVETTQAEPVAVGDVVDVVGFPVRGSYSPILEDAAYRVRSHGSAPQPVHLAAFQDAQMHDQELISFDAPLLDKRLLSNSILLWLNWDDRTIRATLQGPVDQALLDSLPEIGSVLRVTAICSIESAKMELISGVLAPETFEAVLRSRNDLTVLKAAPWWTTQRIVNLLATIVVIGAIVTLVIIVAARRKLKERDMRRKMAEAEFSAILSERNRLAREIHDTLSQGLGAISLQLELSRNQISRDDGVAREHLSIAHDLVRSALKEARASIWDMRSQVLESHDLAGALSGVVRQLVDGTGIISSVEVSGFRRRFSPTVENNVLRIGQEAITNAVKHSHASHITLKLHFEDHGVSLSVSDDGIGLPDLTTFEPKREHGFGLVGMRERAQQLNSELEIHSVPGKGTTLSVTVGQQ